MKSLLTAVTAPARDIPARKFVRVDTDDGPITVEECTVCGMLQPDPDLNPLHAQCPGKPYSEPS